MANRQKTKHKGIYLIGNNYFVTYYDGTKKISKNGEEYFVKREKRIEGNLDAALKFQIEMKEKVRGGKYHIIERMEKTTFKELMDLYKKDRDAKAYVLKFEAAYLDSFKNRKIVSIGRKDLFEFGDKVKKTPKQRGGKEVKDSTVNRALAGLRRLFHYAVSHEYLEESPFPNDPKSGLFSPEQKGKRNFFTEQQMNAIIEASPEWLKPMIVTSYYTGMRAGEILNLKWDFIDFEMGIIYLPYSKTLKDDTGIGQSIVLQKDLINLLKNQPKRSEWVFCQSNDMPYAHWHIIKPFKAILKSLGIDTKKYSWKELRHTTGSLLHIKGVEPIAIKDQLRHTNLKTTIDFYIGADVDYQRTQNERLVLNQRAEA